MVYVGAAWLFLAGNVLPIFIAGMALFVDRAYWQLHKDLGWGSELPGLLLILTGLLGWIPRRLVAWMVTIVVFHFVHTALPALREQVPLLAAVHPLTAMLLAWTSLLHARRATGWLIERRVSPPETVPAQSASQA
jgi:hypothetical protein